MQLIHPKPYQIISDEGYNEAKIVIKASDFENVSFQEGRMTFSFINCDFTKLEIENNETIEFPNIYIQFTDCFIGEIKVDKITTTNLSIFFGSSILDGQIKNENLKNVTVNNCLLNNSLFLFNLKSATVSYTEENIVPHRWTRIYYKYGKPVVDFLKVKQSFYIYDCEDIIFTVNEKEVKDENNADNCLTDEVKKKIEISLSLKYSADREHKLTKIINAKLLTLSISGYSTGELLIENSEIDNWYIHNFSTQLGATFYNIRPFRKESEEKKLEIRESNLDKVWFDNFAFDDYSTISLYRNKFGQTTFTACDFPNDYKDFGKIQTIENIHYPDKKDKNYFKTRYEVFLQFRKLLEASGNFYEAQKFHAVSNEALMNVENLPFWDRQILKINSSSNNHGLSIKEPFIATVFISIAFYLLYLLSLGRLFTSTSFDWNLFGYYFSFLDITHRSDFLVKKEELNGFALTIDYLNKIIIGFLIYQFIAAFRKYGKK
ncbi:hypothetical protein A4C53_RS00635 [Elizabethkingia anophelis]|uniref:hypothetical protein n=1 Tax=Elizabethkingia anophelis TaxID=1117645 RepID=UPI00077EBED0|nr:hypothetical protein [Elizabethkingia anophelis]AMR40855.1 hypothetical protein A2T74_05510 [Elizabethkingia anophelis]AMX47491.1 hypothetical protein A4C56_05510 [Elizabethkingia anophelis]AMX50951.1 hypothetical protein A2T72_05510 [Elizabethkingia anophelis]AMX54343.1 hypothetical protein A2T59_05510 [Elizabethkingia anophelis]EGT4345470.1 hypothetical protein [Elizabethkingia anophelis]